jgi:hypothetical protein
MRFSANFQLCRRRFDGLVGEYVHRTFRNCTGDANVAAPASAMPCVSFDNATVRSR